MNIISPLCKIENVVGVTKSADAIYADKGETHE